MKSKKNVILYIVWGIVSTMLNVVVFRFLILVEIDYQIANLFTLIVVKIFCYITNKLFVFQTPFVDLKHFFKELCSFFLARTATFLIDFFGVTAMVELGECDAFFSKCVISAVVIVVNYILSKNFVFREHTQ